MLGSALNLDEVTVAGLNDVHVSFCTDVFNVGEIEHRGGVDNANGDRRHGVGQHGRASLWCDETFFGAPADRFSQCNIGAGHGRGASATVCAQNVTVEDNRVFA